MTLMIDGVYRQAAVTPSDTTDLGPCRGIYVGTAGNVNLRCKGDDTPTVLVGLATGMWHPMRVQFVYATDTTATNIVVGY